MRETTKLLAALQQQDREEEEEEGKGPQTSRAAATHGTGT